MIKLSSLKPLENNPFKKKDDDQIKKIGESIKSFERMMSIRKIIIDENNEILGGNKRFFALKKLGYKEIPDEWVEQVVDLTEEQKKEFIVKDNSHWGSEWDVEMLNDWGVDLDAWGIPDVKWVEEKLEAKDDNFEVSDIIETDIVLGDLFEIGEHRLLCGDSTDSDMVAKLMNGKKADMVFTDPPYDIDIDYKNILLFSENCNVFIFNNDRAIIRQLKNSPLEFKKFFVFYHSGTAIPQEGGNEVFLDHVLVSHEINGNPKVRYNKGNGTRTVIKGEYRRAEEHKHQKPVSFLSPIIEGYSNVDFIILDLFAGGGSLFSVAHQLNRKCYGMELDPKYCQVIIDRMKKLDSNLTIKKKRKYNIIMALYDKKELIVTAKKAIKENNLFFIEDIVAWLPCVKSTFYEYFPADSDEMDELKAMLEENKIKTKSAIRAKLFRSDKAGELLALYRLICDSDERRMLNQQYIEMEAKDNSLTVNFVGVDKNKKKMMNELRVADCFNFTKNAFDDGYKIVIHNGGTGSGKTYNIMMFLLSVALNNENQVITVVSESRPHLDIGAIRILENLCKPLGLWEKSNWNISTARWTSQHTGSLIEFFSADRIDKALGARRDWLYGNEINSLKLGVWDELARRSENVIGDFNPTSQFWLENWISNYDDTKIIKSNYLNNEFLSETERKRIESRIKKDKNFKRIHFDCEYGVSEGVVFSNWQQIDEMPDGNYIYGLDFGFSNDPTAMVKILETPEAFYIDELIYQTGMLNSQIIKRLEDLNIEKRYDEIIADSAEPKSIQEIHNAGFNIKGAVKGADSIRAGIDKLQSKPIYVTKRSTNLIKELRNYCWVTDKDGRPTNKPIDDYNHLIDATRYAVSPKNNFKFHIA